jgi:hypothetical protein
VGQHGGHDVSIVDLPSPSWHIAAPGNQHLGDSWAILTHLEPLLRCLMSSRMASRVRVVGQA